MENGNSSSRCDLSVTVHVYTCLYQYTTRWAVYCFSLKELQIYVEYVGTGCAPLLQCLDRLSLLPFVGR